ncbi:hypothetical protein I3F58_09935 [Streptomyces sp. MUM 203J]|uniref:hypothetical protein n=1 Tax=Streptomyces sp. MUM 203J TaxID=2791990 RepID=UPI001F03B47F|nr:hypothetical protein [Streptomyces sp. MUM 203J]MCH0539877.1 hypothetical protein [Streptomyces sp. MUM 203J]
MATPSHASAATGAPTRYDPDTGEVRVPIDLWKVDTLVGSTDLVLSRAEAERLHADLSRHLDSPLTVVERP